MKYTTVQTENADDRKLLIGVLIQMGYLWHRNSDGMDDPSDIEGKYPYSKYPIVNIDPDEKYLSGTGHRVASDLNWPEDANEIFENLVDIKKEITIEDVGDYEATIKEDGIHVGCQLITFEKFAEIVEAVKTFK